MATPLSISNLASQDITRAGSITGKTYVGIDFGTSTTVASVAVMTPDGKFKVTPLDIEVKDETGRRSSSQTTPTVIACIDGQPIFGGAAERFKYVLTKDKDIWYSFKMELGEDLGNKYSESVLGEDSPFQVRNPKEAAKFFFYWLKHQIESAVNKMGYPSEIEYAVTIPASFEANQRKDLVEALRDNGISVKNQVLIDEPNAAFLSYVVDSARAGHPICVPEDENLNVLVFDYGAGTCDISILEIGKDWRGIYSKNRAISKFDKCGGDDIDRFIAEKYLLPKILRENGKSEQDLRTKDRKKIIARLMKPAELIKIKICENVSLKSTADGLSPLSFSDDVVTIAQTINFETRIGRLILENPGISYTQFNEAMKTFLNRESRSVSKHGEDEYNSVFTNIGSALSKANMDKDDIDYVLLIGGSSYNPYLQFGLHCYFSESDLLIPSNLQTHVSQGAAIHSLLFNALGLNVINPITSEKILVVLRDGEVKTLIPAGTIIPTEVQVSEGLVVPNSGQKIVEVPICVGSKNQILSVLKIKCPRPEGYRLNESVKIEILITPDKLLKAGVWIDGERYDIAPVNPFANRELTDAEAAVIKAQRTVNDEASKNNGKAGKKSMMDLAEAYGRSGDYFRQAETYEEINERFPGSVSNNNIHVAYSNAGQDEKAREYIEKEYKAHPQDATICFNYGLMFRYKDKEKYLGLMKRAHELDPSDPTHMAAYGWELYDQGKMEEGLPLINKAIDKWKIKLKNNSLRSWEYSWFRSVARVAGQSELIPQINKAEKGSNSPYENENLLRIRNKEE